ncbi:MAG TPA: glycosyltransferase [Gaiellaceae bacterium]|jgi:glycosyltransferase involved in cell wall biosynthesis|nr:glycosyltransferase [Gaiellaceae bacterium]
MRIIHAIARLNVGGAALSVLELAAGQRRRGHDVLVVAGRIPPGEASMEHVAEDLDVPCLHLSTLQREVSAMSDIATVRALRTLIRERRPDVLHTHTSKAGATGRTAAVLAGRARPAAVVHTYHGHVLSGYFGPARERAYRVLERGLALASDRLIAVSDEVRDDLVRRRVAPREKFAVVPYGFDLDARVHTDEATRASKRNESGVGDDTFVIGWAGRLTSIKRPLDLVRAAAAVDRSMLVLAGDGELRADVETLARDLDMTHRVRLLGYVPDMGAWYAAFDAFLLTSRNEGAPVVAIEAQAAAVPVVATDAGGTRTVVDDGETGFVVKVGDIAALADRLTRLRDDRALRRRLGATGAERMRSRFSIERMVDDVDRVYAEILTR